MDDTILLWDYVLYYLDFVRYYIEDIAPVAFKLFLIGTAFFFIEKIMPAEPDTPYFKEGFKIDIGLGLLTLLVLIPGLSIVFVYMQHAIIAPVIPYRMFADDIQNLPFIAQFLLGVLLIDFCTYWRHRFTHVYMWPFHAIHHSTEQMTWSSRLRMHPVDIFVTLLFLALIMHVVGFRSEAMAAAYIYVEAVDYIAHSNLKFGFKGPLRFLISTPHYHRWHHAADKMAYNKNFAGAIPLYDVIFGTYYNPVDKLPEKYGLMPEDQRHYPKTLRGQFAYPFKAIFKKTKKDPPHG